MQFSSAHAHMACASRHAPNKGWKCPVLASYEMWFCQKLIKNAKKTFLWKATSGSAGIHNFQFLAFLSNFWPKIVYLYISALPDVDFTKIAISWLFYCWFWRFWAIIGKYTTGSSSKQDNLKVWQKLVCCHLKARAWGTDAALSFNYGCCLRHNHCIYAHQSHLIWAGEHDNVKWRIIFLYCYTIKRASTICPKTFSFS